MDTEVHQVINGRIMDFKLVLLDIQVSLHIHYYVCACILLMCTACK